MYSPEEQAKREEERLARTVANRSAFNKTAGGSASSQPAPAPETKKPAARVIEQEPEAEGPEIKLSEWTLQPEEGRGKTVELDIQQGIKDIIITPLPSSYEEEITLFIQGANVKFECKHKEIHDEEDGRITETITNVQGLTLPFLLNDRNHQLKNSWNGKGKSFVVTKPVGSV
ncbi:hypothetical protein PROFUN_10788 [Planoprotostelium fungivorum]|uniref:Uncharacterized protein n=1 Tax=Planoprotostelium fungivorum TaxID=1890364 RepID=A0A2P6NCV6_9EUKA|nr:hypothetical protein PROFUN_10788 [Planoprotostelium fungivorum]